MNMEVKKVISCLTSCFFSEQAGGFESADNAGEMWLNDDPDIDEIGDSQFMFRLGDNCFVVKVSKWKAQKRERQERRQS